MIFNQTHKQACVFILFFPTISIKIEARHLCVLQRIGSILIICVRLMFRLSAAAAGALVVRTLRAVRAASRATVASCVVVASVRAARAAIRTLVVRRTATTAAYITLVVRGAIATVTYVTLVVRGAIATVAYVTIVGCRVRLGVRISVRRYVRLGVRILVGRGVGTNVGILVGILMSAADVNVGASTDVDRDRSARTIVISKAVAVAVAPLTHLTIVQNHVQIAGVLIVPTIDDYVKIHSIGVAIATVSPLQIQIEEFRLLTRCKI